MRTRSSAMLLVVLLFLPIGAVAQLLDGNSTDRECTKCSDLCSLVDPVALWTDAVAKAPHKSRCWNNLGMANLVAHREAEAVVAFERAVFLDPANEYASMNLFTARALCAEACTTRQY